ncbi:hypothetical protein JCM10207_008308 [Rhodosporidiobolus poonsookiae]
MRPLSFVPALAALLLAALAQASEAPAPVSVAVASSTPFSFVTRYLETVHHFKPARFHDFLHTLTAYQVRPKATFSNSAFKAPGPGLDGKPRQSRYANHNPIFTRLALANESYYALEATLFRSLIFKPRGEMAAVRFAVVGNVVEPILEEMHQVWQEREAELVASGATKPKKECETWMDVGGKKVCGFDEFWQVVGPKQLIERGVISIEGPSPALHTFDRLLPLARDESLPLVVLYAAPTDEKFPAMFEALYALAAPKAGKPRLQFAIRFKPDTKFSIESYRSGFAVEATIESGFEVPKVDDVADFSARAIGYVQNAADKLEALGKVAASLPVVASDVASTAPVSVKAATTLPEQIMLNDIPVDPSALSHAELVSLLARDRQLFADFAVASSLIEYEVAREIVVGSNLTLEEPRKSASSLAIPTVEKPLKFVNLAHAFRDLHPRFTRAAYLEGVAEEQAEPGVDAPAKATFHVVADLNSAHGRKLVENALRFTDKTGEVRVTFVHNPTPTASAEADRFALSTLLVKLVMGGQLAEVYPSELLEFLELNASADSPPKRSLDDQWTEENPLTPFVNNGASAEDEHDAKTFWQTAATFVERIGVQPGASAVLLNGRLIDLDSHDFAVGSFHALHQYELKRRIRPVVAAVLPVMPNKLIDSRKIQADVFAVATSVIATSGTKRSGLTAEQVKGLTTFDVRDTKDNVYLLTAVIDPLGPTARTLVPVLQALTEFPLFNARIYLLPSALSKVDLTTVSGVSYPFVPQFDANQDEEKYAVSLGHGLPAGTVLDVHVKLLSTEGELAGPGGQGGETVTVEKVPKEVVFAKVGGAVKVEKATEHVRDEL